MMKIALFAILFCFAAFTVAQTTDGLQCDSSLPTCEACLASSGAQAGACGWCAIPTDSGNSRTDFCTTPGTCIRSNGTYVNSTANCTTCTSQQSYAPQVCQFGSNRTFITKFFGSCQTVNNPKPANTSTTTGSTTRTCSISQACLNAITSVGCSTYCAVCNVNNYVQAGSLGKACTSVQTKLNNDSCVQEIANGCISAYPNAIFSNDTATCRPLISANVAASSSTSGSTSGSTTGSTTGTTANGSTVSSQATTASSQATTAASSVSSQATSAATSLASSGNNNGSAAATVVFSFALLAILALFL